MKYALINFIIVLAVNLYLLIHSKEMFIEIFTFKDHIPLGASLFFYLYSIWGLFNLYWFIFELN